MAAKIRFLRPSRLAQRFRRLRLRLLRQLVRRIHRSLHRLHPLEVFQEERNDVGGKTILRGQLATNSSVKSSIWLRMQVSSPSISSTSEDVALYLSSITSRRSSAIFRCSALTSWTGASRDCGGKRIWVRRLASVTKHLLTLHL